MEPQTQKNGLAIPIAIVLGFGLIALAIFFQGGSRTASGPVLGTETNPATETLPGTGGPIRPVDETDHIRGNPNAPIMIVEYSDYDCPFCKNFHETMNQVMDNYGVTGQVAWVYRHFPIESLHPSAPHIAAAAECVAELGGNDAFWTFSDLVFQERGTNDPTNLTRLNEFAGMAGVEVNQFNTCLDSGRTTERVEADLADAAVAGANGTPHSVVLVGGQQAIINGAQPYSVMEEIIEGLLAQIQTEA